MRVFIIGQKGIPAHGGGIERHVEELAIRLASKGQDVFVYARKGYTKSDQATYKGVNVLYTPTIYTKHLEAITHTFLSILNLLRQKQVDIIHIHGIGPSLLVPFARLIKPRAKVISTIHCSDYNHQKWGGFARLALRLGERIGSTMSHLPITVSKGLKKQIKENYKANGVYIPNGVPLPELNSDPESLKQWNIEPGNYIVAVNRLIRHKGVHFLVEAYNQLQTDKKLVIVGGSEYTDDYVKELHELAKGNENIIFTGKQSGDNLKALYQHAYLFVQPSLSEGLSIALLEALSYKQTVLASDIPENLEVVEGIGYTFASGDSKDLAKRLEFLVTHPEIVKQRKELGRDHVAKHYDWGQIADNTIAVYGYTKGSKPRVLRKLINLPKQLA
jgi:glycosyltransferase involved in cell wall biosynthesis